MLGKPKKEQARETGTKKALHTHGYIQIKNGTIYDDSKHAKEAAALHNRSVTIANELNVVGGVKRSKDVTVDAAVSTGGTPIGDPFQDVDEPAYAAGGQNIKHSDPKKPLQLAPGIYGSLAIEKGGTVMLKGPGVFVFNGIQVTGDTSLLKSSNAMIFNVGKFRVDNGADVDLQSMSVSGASQAGTPDYAGIAFWQARCKAKDVGTERCDDVNKAKGQKVQLKGKKKTNGPTSWRFDGAVYAPNSKVEIKGNSEADDAEVDNDDDDTNDTNDEMDGAYDPELQVDFSKSLIVAGELSIGKGGKVVLDAEWPAAAKIPASTAGSRGGVSLVR